MNKLHKLIFLLLLAVSCDDILVHDLSKDTVTPRTPAEGYEGTRDQAVIFWWEELDGATEYELVVASPDITNPQVLALDTVLTKTQISITTIPVGTYQWCVRGINSNYKTDFACRGFSVKE